MSTVLQSNVTIDESVANDPVAFSAVQEAMKYYEESVVSKLSHLEMVPMHIKWQLKSVNSGVTLFLTCREEDNYGSRQVMTFILLSRFLEAWQQRNFMLQFIQEVLKYRFTQMQKHTNEMLSQIDAEESAHGESITG